MLMEVHDGVVPQTFEALEQLPGVGHKTASVVICTAFGYVPALPREKKKNEKITPFGVNLMRSQALYRAAKDCLGPTCAQAAQHSL